MKTKNKIFKEAFELYSKAAEGGEDEAQNLLGWCYEKGLGVKQDLNKTYECYRKAANNEKNKIAKNNLGWCYEKGLGVDVDYFEAVKWYLLAADNGNGNASAMNNLGWLYRTVQGDHQALCKAKEWYEKAAKKEHVSAMHALALCYENGEGVKQDIEKANNYYKKAADKYFYKAIIHLSLLSLMNTANEDCSRNNLDQFDVRQAYVESTSKDSQQQEYAIAFLDLLGAKERIMNKHNSVDEIREIYKRFIEQNNRYYF